MGFLLDLLLNTGNLEKISLVFCKVIEIMYGHQSLLHLLRTLISYNLSRKVSPTYLLP